MASLARLWEATLHVIGVPRALEILQVAGDAGRLRDVVIIVSVAVGAGTRRHHVSAGQWESGLAVIEVGRRPGDRGMARLASL